MSQSATTVVATFDNTEKFLAALEALMAAGIASDRISVLADHDAVVDRFGHIPPVAEMTDNPGTPRESLGTRTAISEAIDFISETVAVLTEIGAATAAYAVGGPVGVATGASAQTQLSVDDLLTEHVDDDWREQMQESVRDGGLICWVQTLNAKESAKAQVALNAAGGTNIHEPASA